MTSIFLIGFIGLCFTLVLGLIAKDSPRYKFVYKEMMIVSGGFIIGLGIMIAGGYRPFKVKIEWTFETTNK